MTTAYKLGRYPSPQDHRDLRAASYLQAVPEPPASVNWGPGQPHWARFLNDQIGDCTIAALAHQIQVWTLNTTGHMAAITNPAVLQRYRDVSGYVPGDDSTDVGANERDVLKLWLAKPFMGHALTAFAAVSPPEQLSVSKIKAFKQSLWVFGGLYLGLDLPLTAQHQTEKGRPWTLGTGSDAAPDSWGGHAVNAVAYSKDGVVVVTWGRLQLISWPFMATYCSEVWANISTDWLKATRSPQGFDLATLEADLAALRTAA